MRRKPQNNNYNFDRMLRTFKRKVQKSGKLEDYRKKQYYVKPAQKKTTENERCKTQSSTDSEREFS